MDENWLNDFENLTKIGNLGFYSHVKVTQIVLIDKKGKAWNYFTNIHFSSVYKQDEKAKFLTDRLEKLNDEYRVAISTYIISIDKFKELYNKAIESQCWEYMDSEIDSVTYLDNVYPTGKKYVSYNDPTGGQYMLIIPLEKSLYGSNFDGNYYILELYSTRKKMQEILTQMDIGKIQSIINRSHMECKCDLCKLQDRIGNIVCKFDVEIVETKVLALAQRGVKYQFGLSNKSVTNKKLFVHIQEEHDNLIYLNENYIVELIPGETKECGVDFNQCKTTITIMDEQTKLIVFRTINDYSVYSNYYSQILPTQFLTQSAKSCRKININGKEEKIYLTNVSGLGDIYYFREMKEAGIRQQRWMDDLFEEQNYFKTYTSNSHKKAIEDIHKILQNQMAWDLEEVWLIDPYLMPKDILETVVFTSKPDIKIKCLTALRTIINNKETKESVNGDIKSEMIRNSFDMAKETYRRELEEAIPCNTDMQLEYRTISDGYGMAFHDRYLILKYNINKTRAWSLGISVNSLGNKHHIIQIVEAPELIADMFERVWEQTNHEVCKIYKTQSINDL